MTVGRAGIGVTAGPGRWCGAAAPDRRGAAQGQRGPLTLSYRADVALPNTALGHDEFAPRPSRRRLRPRGLAARTCWMTSLVLALGSVCPGAKGTR